MKGYRVEGSLEELGVDTSTHLKPRPDVLFDVANQELPVWEVRAQEASWSRAHTAGRKGEEDRGIALRFARFVRVRRDKCMEDATTVDELKGMLVSANRQTNAAGRTTYRKWNEPLERCTVDVPVSGSYSI